MRQRNAAIVDGNPLKLGLFGPNCSSGRTYAALPERWEASWENNVRLAQLADEVGIECVVPIARWKGYGDRYAQGEEWWSIVRRIWAGEGAFDCDETY